MKLRVVLITTIVLLGLWFGSVPAHACFLFVFNCSPPPAPPSPLPPPSPPSFEAVCDGKTLSRFESFGETPCTDANNLKPGEVFTINGRNFAPNSDYTEYGFRKPIGNMPGGGNSPGGEFYPYSNKPGDVYVKADGNGNFTAVADVWTTFGTPMFPYGIYPFRIAMSHYDLKMGDVKEVVVRNLNIVGPSVPPPPPPPLQPQPQPQPLPHPPVPKLPSGGNCDTSDPLNAFRVCYFDGTDAPVGAAPTLYQGYDLSASFSDDYVGSWKGFFHDLGTGITFLTGKSTQVSAVWRGNIRFQEGTYDFHTKSDDGVELSVDGRVVISNWTNHATVQNDANGIKLSKGMHPVQMRWYQNDGDAAVGLWWDFIPLHSSSPTPPQPAPSPLPSPPPAQTPAPPLPQTPAAIPPAQTPTTPPPISHPNPPTPLPVLGIDPPKAKPGEQVVLVSWPGFSNNILVNVYFDDVRFTSFYLDPLDPPQVTIPRTALNGTHTIKITSFDGLGGALSGTVEVYGGKDTANPVLTVTPVAVLAGDPITIKGSGWSKGDKTLFLIDDDGKQIALEHLENRCPLWTNACDEDELMYGANIPSDLSPKTYYVIALGQHDEKAGTEISVLPVKKAESEKPQIVLTPNVGTSGISIAVSGSGFKAKTGLIARFDDGKITMGRGSGLLTDTDGSFNTVISIPLATPGVHHVTFLTGLGESAEADFTIGEPVKKETDQKTDNTTDRTAQTGNDTNTTHGTSGNQGSSTNTGGETPGKSFGGVQTKTYNGVEIKTYDGVEIKTYNGVQAKTYNGLEMKAYGGVKTKEYGDVQAQSFGGMPLAPFGGVTAPKYGDVSAPSYGNVAAPKYGDVSAPRFGDVAAPKYGDVKTNSYGSVPTQSFGGVQAPKYGDVTAPKYGSVPAPSYGDVKAPSYGEGVPTNNYGGVQAPTYDVPKTAPGECNPSIPLYNQPGCKPQSYIDKHSFSASIFDSFSNFFARVFKWATGGSGSKSSAPAVHPDSSKASPSPAQNPPSSKPSPAPSPPSKSPSRSDLAGSYRCFSYNVSGGGGGNCRLFAPIVLNTNGTYSVSSEKGTYRVEGDTITLSESKLRGPGTLLEGNMQIRFEYDYNGWHHTITYLREDTSPASPTSQKPNKSVGITLHIKFPEGDHSADSINTITLETKDGGEQVAQTLAYAIDRQTLEAGFGKQPPKEGIPSGHVYKVLASSGFGDYEVGELDLTNVTQDGMITISAVSQ